MSETRTREQRRARRECVQPRPKVKGHKLVKSKRCVGCADGWCRTHGYAGATERARDALRRGVVA